MADKPKVAPEQPMGGSGARPHAASSTHPMGSRGMRGVEANTGRSKGDRAPDHRAPGPHRQASRGRYTEPSR